MLSTSSCSPKECSAWISRTAGASPVRLRFTRRGPTQVNQICFGGSFTNLILIHHIASPLAGAVDKLVLPEGMQEVNFYYCMCLTGMSEGPLPWSLLKSMVYTESRRTSFIPHFLNTFLLPFFLSRRGYWADEPSRGHEDRELLPLRGHHRYG